MAEAQARHHRVAGDLRLAVCALVSWVWLWRIVDTGRIYAGASLTGLPAYSVDIMYRRAHGWVPGGALGWLAEWLAQWYVRPAVGAAILAVAALLVAISLDRAVTALAGRRVPALRYAPWLLCLLIDGQSIHLLEWQLGWAAALSVAGLALVWREQRPARRAAVLLPAVVALYILLGGPALVALPLLAIDAGRRRETRLLAAALVAAPGWVPWLVWRTLFDQPLGLVYEALLPAPASVDQYGMARSAAMGMVALAMLAGALALRPGERKAPPAAAAWLAPLAACTLLLTIGHDRIGGLRLELCRRAEQRDWPGLLAAARRLAPDEMTQFDDYNVLMALAHTGQVGDQLMRLGLPPISLLRDDPRLGDAIAQRRMRTQFGLLLRDLTLDLGLVNEAEHELHETLETQGPYPQLLVPMARIQALQDRPEAASVLLRMAAAQPGDPAGARTLLARQASDPCLAGDAAQAKLAAGRLSTDCYQVHLIGPLLEQVTREHPDHRLAQEYLLAAYLYGHRLDRLAAALPTLIAPERDTLPCHVEEALLCWEVLSGRDLQLGRFQISAGARRRFDEFVRALGCGYDGLAEVLRRPLHPPASARRVFGGPWTDTYYHYRLFGVSGTPR